MAKFINKKTNIKQKKFKIIFRNPNKTILKFLKKKIFKCKWENPAILSTEIQGIVHLKSSFNNTLMTLTDLSGKIKIKSSSGIAGFRGSKRASKFAAQIATEELSEQAKLLGYTDLNVHLNGLGRARKIFTRGIRKIGLCVHFIKEHTSVSYNGCRPCKIRRL
jgi:small subunit ribosomal protein S11